MIDDALNRGIAERQILLLETKTTEGRSSPDGEICRVVAAALKSAGEQSIA